MFIAKSHQFAQSNLLQKSNNASSLHYPKDYNSINTRDDPTANKEQNIMWVVVKSHIKCMKIING